MLKPAWDYVRGMPAARLDTILAAFLFVAACAELAVPEGVAPADRALALAAILPAVVGMRIRRHDPIAAAVLGMLTIIAMGRVPPAAVEGIGSPWLAAMFLVLSLGYFIPSHRLWLAVAVTVVPSLVALFTDRYENRVDDVLIALALFVAAPLGVGQLLRSRTELARTLREKAERAERARELESEEAIADERGRIAGELHDVVAHALGAMTVQAAAARRLTPKDAERAAAAFGAIETTGREALAELRRLLGVLRREDEEIALAPQPKLSRLRDLARRSAAAGLPVELAVDGAAPDTLPAGVELTAFRLVQEALAEARDSGQAGRARVAVRYGWEDVEVEVTDDGGAAGQRRLLGIRERVRVYGGELRSEERRGGGHRVVARLPLAAGE